MRVAVAAGGEPATRVASLPGAAQLLPGDRVFVAAQPMVRIDTYFGRAIAPLERLLGVILLGNGTVRSLNGQGNNFGGGGGF